MEKRKRKSDMIMQGGLIRGIKVNDVSNNEEIRTVITLG